jgi:hypothetical protein
MPDPCAPDLPPGYRWQFSLREENRDITAEHYATLDATEARIWGEGDGDPFVVLIRDDAESRWRTDGHVEGLYDWETFLSLHDIMHRINLPTEENA